MCCKNSFQLLAGGFLSTLATDNLIQKKYYNTKTTRLHLSRIFVGPLMLKWSVGKKGRVYNFYISGLHKARLLDSITLYNSNKGV